MNQLSYEVACDRFGALGFRFQGNLAKGIADTIEMLHGVRWGIPGGVPSRGG